MAKHTKNGRNEPKDESMDKGVTSDKIQRSIAKKRLLVSSVVLASCLASIIVIGELYSR